MDILGDFYGMKMMSVDILSLPTHPAAECFPLLEETILKLMQSIKENGQREAVAVDDEQKYLIAGRHRREACRRLGISPRYKIVEISGEDYEAVARFVADENLVRFHLDAAQQAMAGAKLANLKNGQHANSFAPGRSLPLDTPPPAPAISLTVAAEITGSSERSISRGKVVLEKGAPELVAAVEQRKIGLKEGEQIARNVPKDEQAGVVARPKDERRASVSPPLPPPAPEPEESPPFGSLTSRRKSLSARLRASTPPTVTALAEQGKKTRPLVDLGERTPEEFEAATALIGLASEIAREAQRFDIENAVRGLSTPERLCLVRDLAVAQDWIKAVSAALVANADQPIAAEPELGPQEADAVDIVPEGGEPALVCSAPKGCRYALCEAKGQCLYQLPGRVDEERPVAAEPLKLRPVYAGDVLFDEVDP